MATVAFKDVKLAQFHESHWVWNALIDAPKPDSRDEMFVTRIEGWALTRGTKPIRIEVYWKDLQIHRSARFPVRPDVQEHYRHIPGATAFGFYADVNLLLLPERFELTVKLCFAQEGGGEGKEVIGTIRGERKLPTLPFVPTIQPLSVYGLGRSGTTLLMRTLCNHPQIVVYDRYPYEMRMLSYMFHAFGVLSGRADHTIAHPDQLMTDFHQVSYNPFHSAADYGKSVSQWFNQQYLEEVSGFTMRSTERFYRSQAQEQGKPQPLYFAEKLPQHARSQFQWALYPQSRGVLLVRDPRDVHCSVLSFNQKRGFASFGFEKLNSEEGFVAQTEVSFRFYWANWKQHPQQMKLVRYEDMIRQPRETLATLAQFLELDDSPSVIEQTVKEAQKDTRHLKQHRTTEDGSQSIGRWKRDLDPKIAELYRERLGEQMQELGYEN